MNYKINLRKISLFLLIILVLSITNAFADIDVSKDIKSAIVGDLDTGEIFYEYNSSQVVEIASITKIMTYIIAREAIEEGKVSLDDEVVISKNAAGTGGSSFGLKTGEKIKFSVLLNSLLIISGNDAAVAVAEHISGNEQAFVKKMHDTAEKIGITTAKFINPNGMPIDVKETDQNYMSTRDVFKMAGYLLKKYPDVTTITSQTELIVPGRNFNKETTNPLLGVMDGVDGLKTGYTDKAGLCLVSTIPFTDNQDNNKNRRVISVLMGAHSHNDRINKSRELLEYGLYNFFIEKITNKDDIVDNIFVSNAVNINVEVKASEEFYRLVKNETNLRTEIKYNDAIQAPLSKGDKVGTMNIYINNEKVKEIPVEVDREVLKADIITRVFRYLANILGI